MVINEKALVRQMEEAFKAYGYTVFVRPGDVWVIRRPGSWSVEIDGQGNVPNEVFSLIVLHMGFLPKPETAYRVYKSDDGPAMQKEVFSVESKDYSALENTRSETDDVPVLVQPTRIRVGKCRVWQRPKDLGIQMIDPDNESIIKNKKNKNVRCVDDSIYAEGEISCVYVSQEMSAATKAQLDHLAQMQWIE